MLIRLLLLVAIAVGGFVVARRAAAKVRERRLRLSSDELDALLGLKERHPSIAEGLDARARLLTIDGIESVPAVVTDVDTAMKELLRHAVLVERMDVSIEELWGKDAQRRMDTLNKKRAGSDVDERERATLERQRETALRLTARKEALEGDMRVLSLGLRDLYVSVLELSASQGGLRKGDTKGAGAALRQTSDDVRRRAEAFDEVEAMIVEQP